MSMDDREKEESQLGELTDALFRERGGFPPLARNPRYQPGQYVPGQTVPPDIAYQGRVGKAVEQFGEFGTVEQSTYVQSTFDARPINGVDFLTKQKVRIAFQNPNGAAVDVPGEVSFIVPQGYVGILRGFAWSFNVPIFPRDDNDSFEMGIVSISVLVNNVAQNFYNDLDAFGANVANFLPTYIIAETGNEIKVRINLGNLNPAGITNTTLYDEDMTITLYGNLLLSRGLPAQFEPGSF